MYKVDSREDGTVNISVFKGNANQSEAGVEYHLSHKNNCPDEGRFYYHDCFIENEAGKTIAAIKPYDEPIKKD